MVRQLTDAKQFRKALDPNATFIYIKVMDCFRWNQWNTEHIAEHGITQPEAEYVVRHARRPYPQLASRGKWLVRGPTAIGRFVQVMYILDPPDAAYVIHARPLTDREKRRYRRRKRR